MAQRPVIPAKIVRPTTEGVWSRTRLFERLDQARRHPIVWIEGPAGSGKTTFAASYVEARGLNCVWYQVDAGDEDLATFFYYLGLAGHAAAPRRKKRFPLLTPEYLLGVPTFSRNFFDELWARLGEDSLLVLDNCHEVTATAPLHEALLTGLSRRPKGASVLLLGRSDPAPPYARLRAHGDMDVIGWDVLRLTSEEFGAIARLRGVEETGQALGRLHDKLDGWAAGLQLVLQAAASRGFTFEDLGRQTPQEIVDYFGGTVFDRLDADTRDFLLKTSFLPSMTVRMAQELTGNPQGGRLLSFLHRNGDFTEKRSHAEPVYQYHPLFREFLRARAAQALAPADLAGVQRTAAHLLAHADWPEDAAGLFCESRDWPGLAGLIQAHAPRLLQQGRHQVLERWLRALPEPALHNEGWLLYWLGAAKLPLAPADAQACFERAFSSFRAQEGEGPGLLLAWAGVVTAIQWGFSDFHAAGPWLELLPSVIGRPENLPPGDVSAQVISSVLAIMLAHVPDHPDLPAWEARALELEGATGDLACRVNILGNLVFLNTLRGRGAVAQALLERLEAAVASGAVSPLATRFTLYFEGACRFAYGDLEQSIAAFRRALELGEATGIHVSELITLAALAQAELSAGHVAEARKCLGRMERLLPFATPWDRGGYRFLKGRLHLIEGELAAALEDGREATRVSREVGGVPGEIVGLLLTAEAHHALGNRRAAFRYLVASLRVARRGMRYLEFPCLLLAARLHFDAGRRSRALTTLRNAMTFGREIDAGRLWALYGPALAVLCARALEAGIEVDFVRTFVGRNRLAPPRELRDPEVWPWPLRIRTLGGCEVLVNGLRLRAPGKAQRKPLALLKALVAFGGRDVSETRLSDALWPDADGDAARRAFATTLHRLRKLLGVKEALMFREGQLSFDPRYCSVDVWVTERHLSEAEAGWRAGPHAQDASRAAEEAERALALYKGSFLPDDVGEPWTVQPRERLRRRFLRGMEGLGTYLEETGRWADAADRYQRALEVDPVIERFYQRLMLCHQKLGRTSEALATFDRCRTVLRRSLGVEPSSETRALANSLRT